MAPKDFFIEKKIEKDDGEKILHLLKITNGDIVKIPMQKKGSDVSSQLGKILHTKEFVPQKKNEMFYQKMRNEICLAFGVPQDHIIIVENENTVRRSFNAFTVIVDKKNIDSKTKLHTAYYAEGRENHAELLKKLFQKATTENPQLSMKAYEEEFEKPEEAKNILFFKGFLPNEFEFKKLPEDTQKELLFVMKNLSQEIGNKNSKEVEKEKTTWFLTGSNIATS